MAKILILYASIGQGHKTASLALQEAFQTAGDHDVVVEDILDYALPVFKSIYADSYLELMEKAPDFMSLLYRLSDKANSEFSRELVALYSRLGVPHFKGFGKKGKPDAVIFTHHLGVHLIKAIMGKHADIKTYSVITDYTTTSMETYPNISRYFVATQIVADILQSKGIEPGKISVTGIPVKKEVIKVKDKKEIQEKLQIKKTPVVTVFGAGIKDSKIRYLLLALLQSFKGTVQVVSGRNIVLEDKIEDIESNETTDIIKYNQVDFVDDIIVASDLIVTKAGGLTISEALARGKPLIFVTGIRGQEEWNADYVCMEGAGVQIHTPELISVAVRSICSNSQRRKDMEKNAVKMGSPHAADIVIQTILSELQS